jgi:hypothetical protein
MLVVCLLSETSNPSTTNVVVDLRRNKRHVLALGTLGSLLGFTMQHCLGSRCLRVLDTQAHV